MSGIVSWKMDQAMERSLFRGFYLSLTAFCSRHGYSKQGLKNTRLLKQAGEKMKKRKCQEATAMGDKLRLLRFRPDRVH